MNNQSQAVHRPPESLFRRDVDWWHNAVLDRHQISWHRYAGGYRLAANALVEYGILHRFNLNFIIYPILFLYRQYLELCLKEIIADTSELLGKEVRVCITHNIQVLWREARENLAAVLRDSATGELERVGTAIEQFCAADPTSMAFRYPTGTRGEPIHPPIEHVNVRALADAMTLVANVLETAVQQLGIELDEKRESDSE